MQGGRGGAGPNSDEGTDTVVPTLSKYILGGSNNFFLKDMFFLSGTAFWSTVDVPEIHNSSTVFSI